jgi:hypothetical protein
VRKSADESSGATIVAAQTCTFDLKKDVGSPGLLAQVVELKAQLAQLQDLLNEAHDLSEQKDQVIAKLEAMAVKSEQKDQVIAELQQAMAAKSDQKDQAIAKLQQAMAVESKEKDQVIAELEEAVAAKSDQKDLAIAKLQAAVAAKSDQKDLAIAKLQEAIAAKSEEKDQAIARLQEAMAVKGEMVLEGSAYFSRQDDKIVDGPFCTCCFDRDHQRIRLVPGAKPEGAPGRPSEWVQCPNCRTPFRSKKASDYIKGQQAEAARGSVSTKKQSDRPKGRSTPQRSRRGSKAKTD